MVSTRVIFLALAAAAVTPAILGAQENRTLRVHLAQANNDSPYALVRAKFKPGELADPWAVRFFDDKGTEVPYFVWDSVTWKVAREGRPDWGNRYALINHAAGDTADVTSARGQKLAWARKNLPDLGARLEADEQAAARAPDSVCAALYLLRYHVGAFGKDRLTLRIDAAPKTAPKRQTWKAGSKAIAASQGDLAFRNLPDQLTVAWRGALFRMLGFNAGGWSQTVSHADPERPFTVETTENGVCTKVHLVGQTEGRKNGTMDWQCTYWLFPEGGFVGLEGFSISDTTDYNGGPQKLGIWGTTDGKFTTLAEPTWDKPWWLHQAGARGFVATHLFQNTPLTVGFGNNPFTVNSDAKDKEPKVENLGEQLVLSWVHRVDDPAIQRVMAPQPFRKLSDPAPKEQPKPGWRPRTDWLYRQFVAAVNEKAEGAEKTMGKILGAAAGWIDRPISEEEGATLLVQMMPRIARGRESSEIGLLKIVPAALSGDRTAIQTALGNSKDQAARTDFYINLVRRHVELGGRPSEGKKKDDKDGTGREGWTGNPCYHAALMPTQVRVMEHFELPFPQKAYREAILRYADFSLDILSYRKPGEPIDFDKFNATIQTEWPSRVVPIFPLMLHAHTLKPDEKYAKAVKLLWGPDAAGRAQPARLLPGLDVQAESRPLRHRLQPGQLRARHHGAVGRQPA
jgi:hypothetical protein